jgi:hypothetical protein
MISGAIIGAKYGAQYYGFKGAIIGALAGGVVGALLGRFVIAPIVTQAYFAIEAPTIANQIIASYLALMGFRLKDIPASHFMPMRQKIIDLINMLGEGRISPQLFEYKVLIVLIFERILLGK